MKTFFQVTDIIKNYKMTDFHKTIIDTITNYLEDADDVIIDCYHTYDKWGNKTDIYDEIRDFIDESCYFILDGFDLSKMSADTLLEIQIALVDEYGMECVGDSLFKKDHLITWYMMSNGVVNDIKCKYDIIKIQRLWRGYDCRWKNPFLLLKE